MDRMTHETVKRLRDYDNCNDGDVDEAADLLEFLLARFRPVTTIGGNHWRFATEWPWTHATGPDIETAIRAAMEEEKRVKEPTT